MFFAKHEKQFLHALVCMSYEHWSAKHKKPFHRVNSIRSFFIGITIPLIVAVMMWKRGATGTLQQSTAVALLILLAACIALAISRRHTEKQIQKKLGPNTADAWYKEIIDFKGEPSEEKILYDLLRAGNDQNLQKFAQHMDEASRSPRLSKLLFIQGMAELKGSSPAEVK